MVVYRVQQNFFSKIIIAILLLLSVLSIAKGCMNAMKYPGGNFDFHYPAFTSMASRVNPYGEEVSILHHELGLDIRYTASYGPTNQLPSAILLLTPLAFLKPSAADLLWCICNVLFSAGIAILIKSLFIDKFYTGTNKIFIALIFAAVLFMGTPLRNSIGNGQNNIISVFFFLLSLWLSEKDHRILAGISLSATLFKYTLTVPLYLYYIYKKKYKEIITAACVNILLTLAAAVWLGVSPVEMVIMSLHVSSKLSAQGMYDICSLLGIQGISVSVMLFLLTAAFVYYCSIKIPGHDGEIISMLVLFSLIFVYHRIYEYFVLIIPFAVIMTSHKYSLPEKIITCLCIAYIFFFQRITLSLCSESINLILHYSFAVMFYLMFFCMIYRLAKNIQL